MSGLFVTFEGGEGSGKSTQAELLAGRVREAGNEALVLREPGGTPLGEALRRVLLHDHLATTFEAEVLLFLAARAELVNTVLRPALEGGATVICDRFSDSTIAYQGYGRGLDIDSIRMLDRWATGGLRPDLTVLLDVPIDVGRKRKHADDDIFFKENDAFHTRVREGYLFLAAREPERWFVVDGTQSPEAIAGLVWGRVRERLGI